MFYGPLFCVFVVHAAVLVLLQLFTEAMQFVHNGKFSVAPSNRK